MVPERIPETIEEITPEWLTLALRSTGVIEKATITSVDSSDLAIKGRESLARLEISYDALEECAPASLVAKLPTTNPEGRVRLSEQGIYEREIRFYQDLAVDAPIATPRCYYSDMVPSSHKYVLLLEDLSDASAGNHLNGCTPDEAENAIRGIASLHAHYWDCGRSQTLGWIPDFRELSQHSYDGYLRNWPIFRVKYREKTSAYLLDVGERLGLNLKQVCSNLSQDPVTLLHGDLRLDNFLFSPTTGGRSCVLLDWQTIKRGRSMVDTGFFLGLNFDEHDRRKIEHDLLTTYWSILRDNKVEDYSFEQLMHDYRLSLFTTLQLVVSALVNMNVISQRMDALLTALLRRLSAALEDNDVAALLQY